MDDQTLDYATRVVAAYVGHNTIPKEEVPDFICSIRRALNGGQEETAKTAQIKPAVPIKTSVFPDKIICLECGKDLQMLKRHLKSYHGLTIEDYKNRWDLAENYPTTAPNYSTKRSGMAKNVGLGRTRTRKPGNKTGKPRKKK